MREVLHSCYVIIASCLLTFLYAVRVLFWLLLSNQPRRWTDKVILSWANCMIRIANIDCTVFNPNNVKIDEKKLTIIMCNHSSNYDIPLSFTVFPKASIRMLAKKEMSRMPMVGTAMNRLEFLFVDRKNRNQAIKDLEEVQKLMQSGIVMWIAPEGTRSRSGKLLKFKKGGFITAINAKATIIPIGIRGAYNIMRPGSLRLNLNPKAEIHVGSPIDASKFGLNDKDNLIDKVRAEIALLSEVTKTENVSVGGQLS